MAERPIRTAADWTALFGARARQLGLTHEQVELRAGLGDGHFSKVMSRRRTPSLRTVEKLCAALEIAITARSYFAAESQIGDSVSANVGHAHVEKAT